MKTARKSAGQVVILESATVFRSVQFPRPVEVQSIKTQLKDGILQVSAAIEGAAPAQPERVPARKPGAKKAAKA